MGEARGRLWLYGIGLIVVCAAIFLSLKLGTTWLSSPPAELPEAGASGTAPPAPRGRTIQVRVQDAESRSALEGAQVRLGAQEARTDRGGLVAFASVEGPARIEVDAPGYLPLKAPVEVGAEAQEAVVPLWQRAEVQGRATAGGQGVAGGRVSVVWLAGGAGQRAGEVEATPTVTGPDGSFALELPAGRLRVLVEADGYALGESREVRLVGGRRVDGLEVDLTQRGDLRVEVVEEGGEAPVGEARVEVRGMPTWRGGAATTDAAGIAVLSGLPVGEVELRVSAPRYSTVVSGPVGLEAGAEVTVRVALPTLKGVSGVVRGPDGEEVAEAVVEIHPEGLAGSVTSTSADGLGRFVFAGIEAGRYIARASHVRYGPSAPVVFDAGSADEVELTLAAGGVIVGRVVGRAGPVTERARVIVERYHAAGEAAWAQGGEEGLSGQHFDPAEEQDEGRFALRGLGPGRYDLYADVPGQGIGRLAGVHVRAGEQTGPVEIVIEEGATLTGRVIDARTRAPVAQADVVLDSDGRRMLGLEGVSMKTDEDGNFAFTGIEQGRRSIHVSHGGYVTRIMAGLELSRKGERDVEVALTPREGEGPPQIEFFGIGAVLEGTEAGTVRIRQALEGAPGARSGLQPGDEILRVDGQETSLLGLGRTVELIRGEEDSDVELEIRREGDPHPIKVRVTRGRVSYEEK